jgi:Tol biopolymer transport system component
VIGQASLSPDGNFIAFWMGRDYQILPKLGVLDLRTLQVTNYCIPGSRNGSWAPIWSPDSNYLAVMSDVTLAESYAVIVSVEGEWAAKVGEGYLPEGWMVSP